MTFWTKFCTKFIFPDGLVTQKPMARLVQQKNVSFIILNLQAQTEKDKMKANLNWNTSENARTEQRMKKMKDQFKNQ